eukprot:CAMPEP_0119551236 /NCGR_PEP_ID=MMETSP1352-20130426/4542_1 /TAXON_ID=265584 /ORGANISM="Stauroneis constricta, Strain CCMP1120" /LENGTH=608 /DNA_ID=CAMNT_0007597257 /DNA_START=131 /DNA_END=1957 /DNA_ORIENTATION=+
MSGSVPNPTNGGALTNAIAATLPDPVAVHVPLDPPGTVWTANHDVLPSQAAGVGDAAEKGDGTQVAATGTAPPYDAHGGIQRQQQMLQQQQQQILQQAAAPGGANGANPNAGLPGVQNVSVHDDGAMALLSLASNAADGTAEGAAPNGQENGAAASNPSQPTEYAEASQNANGGVPVQAVNAVPTPHTGTNGAVPLAATAATTIATTAGASADATSQQSLHRTQNILPGALNRSLAAPAERKANPQRGRTTDGRPLTPPDFWYWLPIAEVLRDWDVLCGRGGESNNFVGNRRYRSLVNDRKEAYRNIPVQQRKVKTEFVKAIVQQVHMNGGRFVDLYEPKGWYYVVTNERARKKTSQALRETKELKWIRKDGGGPPKPGTPIPPRRDRSKSYKNSICRHCGKKGHKTRLAKTCSMHWQYCEVKGRPTPEEEMLMEDAAANRQNGAGGVPNNTAIVATRTMPYLQHQQQQQQQHIPGRFLPSQQPAQLQHQQYAAVNVNGEVTMQQQQPSPQVANIGNQYHQLHPGVPTMAPSPYDGNMPLPVPLNQNGNGNNPPPVQRLNMTNPGGMIETTTYQVVPHTTATAASYQGGKRPMDGNEPIAAADKRTKT